ncbi:MAG: hypothetical protein CBB71_08300 [Rhodopirellula sp. TMED11]|nr:MAG: hypothetical protein CBB71_08300 [Rhodopirellula sp. TMED11]
MLARTNRTAAHNWSAIAWNFRIRTTGLEEFLSSGARTHDRVACPQLVLSQIRTKENAEAQIAPS